MNTNLFVKIGMLSSVIALILIAGCAVQKGTEGQVCIPPEKAAQLGLISPSGATQPKANVTNVSQPEKTEIPTVPQQPVEQPTANVTNATKVANATKEEEKPQLNQTPTPPPEENKTQPTPPPIGEAALIKKVVEGNLVDLSKVKAVDADGDTVSYTYTAPLDENGKWQTKIGDAGNYITMITASDGKSQTSIKVKIEVLPKNRPPVISLKSDTVTVNEGETVVLNPEVTDPDGDNVTVSYSGWMTSNTKKTDYNSAGTYTVTITATDGVNTVKKNVTVNVLNVNRAPVFKKLSPVTVVEGQKVEVKPVVSDPDGDKVKITFSAPLDENGVWQTTEGDAGTYTVTVGASDGKTEVTKDVVVKVEPMNHPPVISNVKDVLVNAGETVVLTPEVTDPDGDTTTVTYSGWMTSNTKKTTEADGGKHNVTITASDGKLETSKTITVTVNRAPVFVEV